MQVTEKQFEDYLFERPELLNMSRWLGRQVIVPSGILDLIGINEDYNAVFVFELKAGNLLSEHITQVSRYASDIECAMYDLGIARFDGVPNVYKAIAYIGDYPEKRILEEASSVDVRIYKAIDMFNCVFSEELTFNFIMNTTDKRKEKRENIRKTLSQLVNNKKDIEETL